MNFGNIKSLSRQYLPTATPKKIDATDLELIINEGIVDICSITKCLYKEKNFSPVAEQQNYLISTVAPDFLTIRKEGIWWNSGTQASPDWDSLDALTQKALDNKFTNWRDDDSDDPKRYVILENTIKIHPKPSESLTDGFLIYYARKPETMSSDSDYPFHIDGNKSIQISQLEPLTECIFTFIEWKLSKIVGKGKDEQRVRYSDYKAHVDERMKLVSRRDDILANEDTRMRGRRIR